MRYAKSKENVIVEMYESPGMTAIEDCFHPSIACEYFEAVGDMQVGWVLNEDGVWVAPPVEIPAQEPPAVE